MNAAYIFHLQQPCKNRGVELSDNGDGTVTINGQRCETISECDRLLESIPRIEMVESKLDIKHNLEILRLRIAMARAAQRADDWPDSNDDPADVLEDCASILYNALDAKPLV